MYDEHSHTAVEGFILKWTLISTFTGVVMIFIYKILALFGLYMTSGKFAKDFIQYIWLAIKASMGL